MLKRPGISGYDRIDQYWRSFEIGRRGSKWVEILFYYFNKSLEQNLRNTQGRDFEICKHLLQLLWLKGLAWCLRIDFVVRCKLRWGRWHSVARNTWLRQLRTLDHVWVVEHLSICSACYQLDSSYNAVGSVAKILKSTFRQFCVR